MQPPHPVEEAEGPYDAAFLPRMEMVFRPSEEPITEVVGKLGGDPVWLGEPCWPVHPGTHEPLDFVGQFPVPREAGEEVRMAYLFLSSDGCRTGGKDAEDGEAVLIVQPGGRVPAFAVVGEEGTKGRSLWGFGDDQGQVPVEFGVELRAVDEDVERGFEEGGIVRMDDYLGGWPSYPDWAGVDAPWRFFFTLMGTHRGHPYHLNFAHGSGYAYLSPDRLEGRFQWEPA